MTDEVYYKDEINAQIEMIQLKDQKILVSFSQRDYIGVVDRSSR